jgi:hypothetical protein
MATKLTSVITDQVNAVNAVDTNAVAATIAEDKRLPARDCRHNVSQRAASGRRQNPACRGASRQFRR